MTGAQTDGRLFVTVASVLSLQQPCSAQRWLRVRNVDRAGVATIMQSQRVLKKPTRLFVEIGRILSGATT